MEKKFYSNGKLLLTGEYLVLDGASALALPTAFGQDLVIRPASGNSIKWTSFDHDGSVWFEAAFSFANIRNYQPDDTGDPSKETLLKILHEAFLLDSKFVDKPDGYSISTHLSFPKQWGLGTSSTLINNIALWLDINPFTLLKNSFGGSGYDIACAGSNKPVLYQLVNGEPAFRVTNFNPPFADQLYFVYLNKKQSSKQAIATYSTKQKEQKDIQSISTITKSLSDCTDVTKFAELLQQHETIMSGILQVPTVKETLFPDYNGTLKSLGAWGGDFILAISKEDPGPYFHAKGFQTVIPFAGMILRY